MFYYRLADDKKMGVRQMLREIDSDEITYWVAYYKIKADEKKKAEKRRNMSSNVRNRARGRR